MLFRCVRLYSKVLRHKFKIFLLTTVHVVQLMFVFNKFILPVCSKMSTNKFTTRQELGLIKKNSRSLNLKLIQCKFQGYGFFTKNYLLFNVVLQTTDCGFCLFLSVIVALGLKLANWNLVEQHHQLLYVWCRR